MTLPIIIAAIILLSGYLYLGWWWRCVSDEHNRLDDVRRDITAERKRIQCLNNQPCQSCEEKDHQ